MCGRVNAYCCMRVVRARMFEGLCTWELAGTAKSSRPGLCMRVLASSVGVTPDLSHGQNTMAGDYSDSAAYTQCHPSRCGLKLLDGFSKVTCEPRGLC
jgi:hypothetical protein